MFTRVDEIPKLLDGFAFHALFLQYDSHLVFLIDLLAHHKTTELIPICKFCYSNTPPTSTKLLSSTMAFFL